MLLALTFLLAQTGPTAPPPPPVLGSPVPQASASPATAPSLVATPANVGLRPGGSVMVKIDGAAGAITAAFAGSTPLATIRIDQPSQTITISATAQLGSGSLHVVDALGSFVDVPVRVAQDAGTVPAQVSLKITGSPVDPAWLQAQIVGAVARTALVRAGAQLTVTPQASFSPPPPGASLQLDVPVQITGGASYWDVGGTSTVNVQNVPAEPFAPPTLYYDDDPERVNADGVLYRATLTAAAPAQLYYYHDAGSDAHRIVVALSTSPGVPASVQIIDSSAGPNLDVMSVGHAATKGFLLMQPHNEGVIVDLDGSQPYALHDLAVSPHQGIAGTIAAQVLSGGPVTFTVLSVAPGADPAAMLDGPLLPGDGHHRTGAFSILNYGTTSLAYAVGGPDAKLVYGDRDETPQNLDPSSPGHDYGDYGVMHTLLFSLSNPTGATANAYLYERPIGGIVRSSFLVDGNLVEVGCVRQSVPYQIAAFALQPNAKYQLAVLTMTDGGSNYPIEVGVTAAAPLPSAPPISSPDGCFPKPGGAPPAPSPSPIPSSSPG